MGGFDWGGLSEDMFETDDDPYGLKQLASFGGGQDFNPTPDTVTPDITPEVTPMPESPEVPNDIFTGMDAPAPQDDMQRLMELSSAPSESEGMLADYANKRADIEKKGPGVGRTILGSIAGMLPILLGGDVKSGTNLASAIFNEPRDTALGKWEAEGVGVNARAKAVDAAKNRELQALKYNITNKSMEDRAKSNEAYKREQADQRKNEHAASLEERIRNDENNLELRKGNADLSRQIFEQRKSDSEWKKAEAARDNTRIDDENKFRHQQLADKASSLEQANKHLFANASRHGVDTSNKTALDVSREMAFNDAKIHPAFRDLLEKSDNEDDPNTEFGYKIKSDNPERVRQLKIYLANLSKKYLDGER